MPASARRPALPVCATSLLAVVLLAAAPALARAAGAVPTVTTASASVVQENAALPPTETLTCDPRGWTNTPVTCTADVTPGTSGNPTIANVTYTLNGAATATGSVANLTDDGSGGQTGTFTLDRSTLSEGVNTVAVSATDGAGLSDTTDATALFDDQTPEVSLNAVNDPLSGSVKFTGSVALAPVADVTPPYELPAVTSAVVQYSVDGGADWMTACHIDDPITWVPESCVWDTTGVADGTYQLRETVTDGAGNVGSSAAQAVTIQNQQPTTSTPTQTTGEPAQTATTVAQTTSTPTTSTPTTTTPFTPVHLGAASFFASQAPPTLSGKVATLKSAGKPDTYTLTATTDFTSGAAIVGYNWALGVKTLSQASTLTYRFTRAGTYTLTLTATDASGRSAAATLKVHVPEPEAMTAVVGFAPGSSALPTRARRELEKLRATLKRSRTVTVTGYPDGSVAPRSTQAGGSPRKLAKARAKSVAALLFGKHVPKAVKLNVTGGSAASQISRRVTVAYTVTWATKLSVTSQS